MGGVGHFFPASIRPVWLAGSRSEADEKGEQTVTMGGWVIFSPGGADLRSKLKRPPKGRAFICALFQ
jgi:hypothetical protein